MSNDRNYLAEFLRARRELLQPEEVGLPRDDVRRVPGLRREELAALAGISVDYYLRLEQGRDHQPSEQVLSALGRALQLDDDTNAYLHRIVQLSAGYRGREATREVPTGVLRLLEQWGHTPAYVTDSNLDIVAANDLARRLAPGGFDPGVNLLFSVFGYSGEVADDDVWMTTARRLVAALRYQSDPTDPRLQEILGRLSVEHRLFRQMWATHDAKPQSSGTILNYMGPFGWVELNWQTLDIPGEAGLSLTTLFADPGTPGAAAISALASEHDRTDAR